MNLISFEEISDSEIRVTDDGRYSVYDLIRFCTGNKNPSQLWNGDKTDRKTKQKGLVERFPEVIRKTDNFKFPERVTGISQKLKSTWEGRERAKVGTRSQGDA